MSIAHWWKLSFRSTYLRRNVSELFVALNKLNWVILSRGLGFFNLKMQNEAIVDMHLALGMNLAAKRLLKCIEHQEERNLANSFYLLKKPRNCFDFHENFSLLKTKGDWERNSVQWNDSVSLLQRNISVEWWLELYNQQVLRINYPNIEC